MRTGRCTLPLLLPIWALAVSWGCSAERVEIFDLVAGLPAADLGTETRALDFGTETGRRQLLAGWSRDLWDRRREESFVRGVGGESVLEIELLRQRSILLELDCKWTPKRSEGQMALAVLVNGHPAESLELKPRRKRYRLQLSAGMLRTGGNEIVFQYRSAAAKAPGAGSADPGASVAWYGAAVRSEQQAPPVPREINEGEALLIPYGTRSEYYLRLPDQATLAADGLRFAGGSGGSLEILIEADLQPPRLVARLDSPSPAFELELAAKAGVSRLTLRAIAPAAEDAPEPGVMLARPSIRAPRPKSVAAPRAADPDSVAAPASGRAVRPNVLLYVVDTLRADHLGIYGYPQPVSPHLDRFAAEATVFDNAIAQSSWTRASMASIFTGLWPVKHAANGRRDILAPEARTLAEILQEAGYTTVAMARNWNIFPVFGFSQGFDDFRALTKGKADRVNQAAKTWMATRDPSRPFLLYLHTVDPHGPYRPPEEYRERFALPGQKSFSLDRHPGFKTTRAMSQQEKERLVAHLKSLYDAEIAFNDQAFGELVEMLRAESLLDSTLLVFVSDHGEEFLEHGTWEHGRNLFAENLDIPLLIRFPDLGHGLRIEEVVQHIDILPTILDYVGLPIPETVEGRSLVDLVAPASDGAGRAPEAAYSFLHLDGLPHRSLVEGDWKLIQRLHGERIVWSGLFHRREDGGDEENLILQYPVQARYMAKRLAARAQEGSLLQTEEAVLDARTERALRALGYLQ